MLKFIFFKDNKLNIRAIFVIVMSIVSGLLAASLASIINEAAEIIIIQDHSDAVLYFIPLFLFLLTLLLFTRRIALRSGVELVETSLEIYRNNIGNQLRQSELLKMENIDQGEIYTKLSIDTKKISRASLSAIRTIQSIVTVVVVIIYIFTLSIQAGICFMFFFTLGIIYYQIHYMFLVNTIEEMAQKETRLFDNFGHLLDGFKEIKLNTAKNEDFFHNNMIPLGNAVKMLRIEIGNGFIDIARFCFVLLFYLALGSIIFILPTTFSIALRFKILAMSAFLWEPIGLLSESIPVVISAKVSINRLIDLEKQLNTSSTFSEYVSRSQPDALNSFRCLQIKSLCFNYTDSDGKRIFGIDSINAKINEGEIVFFVGGNGSGKSTVLKLISGLYPPLSGSFLLNGSEINITQYKYLFSVVFTDCYVFDGLYGISNICDQEVQKLLKLMSIDHKVKWKNQKLQHSGLSTGQKKRLALIIAILEDRPILVLDEWAAEQDPAFRKMFYTELLPMLKNRGKTIIAATHDDKYYDVADLVIKMQYGKIIS